MKNQEKSENGNAVVYRKDGKTPDMRYKSSKDFVLTQNLEENKKQPNDWRTPDFKYKSLRAHVLSKQTGMNKNNPVQIKPVGKKPVWKIN
jgi:hypothetical protein